MGIAQEGGSFLMDLESITKAYEEAAMDRLDAEIEVDNAAYALALAESEFIIKVMDDAVQDGRDPLKAYGTNDADRKRSLTLGTAQDPALRSAMIAMRQAQRKAAGSKAKAEAIHDYLHWTS